MEDKLGVNVVIEREDVGGKDVFIVSSPDVNVLAEGKSVEEAKVKFLEGLKIHLMQFPEEKNSLIAEKEKYEMPMVARLFL
ncbi:MAG: hypothetical protein PVJ67_00505 [Candidatus Pacearchaeota archaeon]